MNNNIKSIILLLCIGSFAHLNAILDEGEINKTIEAALNSYDPSKAVSQQFSLSDAAAQWANALVSQLTTAERVALAYFCLTLQNNQTANDTSTKPFERIITQIAYGKVPVDEKYTRALAEKHNLTGQLPVSWTKAKDIPFFGIFAEGVSNIKRGFTTASYQEKLYWPYISSYIQNYSSKTGSENAEQFLVRLQRDLVAAAVKDLSNPEFGNNAQLYFKNKSFQNVGYDDLITDLTQTLDDAIRIALQANNLEVPTNLFAIISSLLQTHYQQLANAFENMKAAAIRGVGPQFAPVRRTTRQTQPTQRTQTISMQQQSRRGTPTDRDNVNLAIRLIARNPFSITPQQLNKIRQHVNQWQNIINDGYYLNEDERENLNKIIHILESALTQEEEQPQRRRQSRYYSEEEEEEEELQRKTLPAKGAKTPVSARKVPATRRQTKIAAKQAPATKQAITARQVAVSGNPKAFVDKFMKNVPRGATNRKETRKKLAENLTQMPISYPSGMKLPRRKEEHRKRQIEIALEYFDELWPA